ncbi:MAG TPA: hypothetical protein VNI58_05030 [Mariprofundaceae bacterium]|nr:hypothetical protein [Mariprofundaceae bacterium]
MFWIKVLVSAVAVAAASEVAKRIGPFWAAVIVVLPLTSMLALAFTWFETRDDALATAFARDVFVLVPLSLLFFVPFLLNKFTGFGFIANFVAGTILLLVAVLLIRRLLPGLI